MHYSPSPLLWSISSNFLMLSSRAWRVCFCVSIRVSNSYKEKDKNSIQGQVHNLSSSQVCTFSADIMVYLPISSSFSFSGWWWKCWMHHHFLKRNSVSEQRNFNLESSVTPQCLKSTQKVSSVWAKRAMLIIKKTLGCTFLPLMNSFEFLQILVIYSIKRITKNSKEFSRGKNVSPKVSKVIDS